MHLNGFPIPLPFLFKPHLRSWSIIADTTMHLVLHTTFLKYESSYIYNQIELVRNPFLRYCLSLGCLTRIAQMSGQINNRILFLTVLMLEAQDWGVSTVNNRGTGSCLDCRLL